MSMLFFFFSPSLAFFFSVFFFLMLLLMNTHNFYCDFPFSQYSKNGNFCNIHHYFELICESYFVSPNNIRKTNKLRFLGICAK